MIIYKMYQTIMKHYQQNKRNHEREDFTRTAVYLAANIKRYLMNEICLGASGDNSNIFELAVGAAWWDALKVWCVEFMLGTN